MFFTNSSKWRSLFSHKSNMMKRFNGDSDSIHKEQVQCQKMAKVKEYVKF